MDIIYNIGFFTGQNMGNIADCLVNTSIGVMMLEMLQLSVKAIAEPLKGFLEDLFESIGEA